jgi:hypothetical protein
LLFSRPRPVFIFILEKANVVIQIVLCLVAVVTIFHAVAAVMYALVVEGRDPAAVVNRVC